MKALTQFTFAALLALLTFASCKKDQAEPQPQFNQAETDNDIREMMEEMELASQAIQSAQAQNKLFKPECAQYLDFPECATVTVERLSDGRNGSTINVNYGDGCMDNDVLKSGTLIITIVDNPQDATFSITTTYANYGRQNKTWNGSRTITNVTEEMGALYGAGNPVFKEDVLVWYFTVKKGKAVKSITEAEYFIEWKEGMNSAACNENVFGYEGTSTRTVKVDNELLWTVTREFVTPVQYEETCGQFVSGEMTVVKSGGGKFLSLRFR